VWQIAIITHLQNFEFHHVHYRPKHRQTSHNDLSFLRKKFSCSILNAQRICNFFTVSKERQLVKRSELLKPRMSEELSTASHLPDAMTTAEETYTTRGNTVTSWRSSGEIFYFRLLVIVIGAVGTAGNALILYAMVASKQHMKHLLIFNQNVIDLYSCVFLVITNSVKIFNLSLAGSLGYWLCTLFISDTFVWVGNVASVINLATITVERYLKVCSKKKVRKWMIYLAITFTWIGSVVYNVTVVFSTTIVVNGTCRSYVIFRDQSAKLFYVIWNVLSFYVSIIFIFIFCYGRILIVIRRQAQVMASHTTPQSSTTQTQLHQLQTNVIKTMIFVSAFYAVMWFPNYVVMLLYYFLFPNGNDVIIICYYASLLCEFLYMCTNPFIYATKFEPVKQVLVRMIPCKNT